MSGQTTLPLLPYLPGFETMKALKEENRALKEHLDFVRCQKVICNQISASTTEN